jgi:hypothetical protein
MWIVEPELGGDSHRTAANIDIDSIVLRASALSIDRRIGFNELLDVWSVLYMNKYTNYNSFEIIIRIRRITQIPRLLSLGSLYRVRL